MRLTRTATTPAFIGTIVSPVSRSVPESTCVAAKGTIPTSITRRYPSAAAMVATASPAALSPFSHMPIRLLPPLKNRSAAPAVSTSAITILIRIV